MILVKLFVTFFCVFGSTSGLSDLMKDVTEEAFGTISTRDMWPMAFLDFNSDKLTDVVMLSDNSRTLSIFLASKENVLGVIRPHFDTNARFNHLECKLTSEGRIVSVLPADFDGDGSVELVAIIKGDKLKNYWARVIWAERTQGHSGLNCSGLINTTYSIEMKIEPMILDANGDDIADLFGVNANGTKGFWIFSSNRGQLPEFQPLQVVATSGDADMSTSALFDTHSNAFIDLNEDGNADIFVSTGNRFEIYENIGGLTFADSSTGNGSPNFRFSKSVHLNNCGTECLVGQAAFADFDQSGHLSILLPVCHDGSKCQDFAIYIAQVKDMFEGGENFKFERVLLETTSDLTFDFWTPDKKSIHPFNPLTPRLGDFDLDGFPDILIRMKNTTSRIFTNQVLLNVKVDLPNFFRRGFQVQPEVIGASVSVVAATFFDMYEDGILEILAIQEAGKDQMKVAVYANNTLSGSGYFLKVKVLNGVCFDDCKTPDLPVPYGTNLPGQKVCYKLQSMLVGATKSSGYDSCAAQLTQTSHVPLQLPYVHFGLGSDLLYVDEVMVSVTNASDASHSRSFTELLVPNSAIYVIPYPSQDPDNWKLKMFISANRKIFLTGVTLLGMILVLALSILFLHIKEKREERIELLQDTAVQSFQTM